MFIDFNKVKEYYNREDIKRAILNLARDREIAIKLKNGKFGKRPLSINTIKELELLLKQSPLSFHCSEERWINPELLKNSTTEIQNQNRKGWDLIIDIDGIFEYSKIVADVILKFFKKIDIKYATIKFSGNKGFHIGIPWEAFSEEIYGLGKTKDLFPEAPKKIANYILCETEQEISKKIIDLEGSIEKIAEKNNLKINEIKDKKNNLILNKLVDIDTLLISSRHLFRMTYSLNEKSGLVSIPVNKEKIMEFKKGFAKIENVKPEFNKNFEFLMYKENYGKFANNLLINAFDYDSESLFYKNIYNKEKQINYFYEIKELIPEKRFPETIKFILNNKFEDGRKRALFVLLTFLINVNWSFDNIEKIILQWGKEQGLKETYTKSQLTWFKNRIKNNKDKKNRLNPPNFDKKEYYEDIGIPLEILKKDISYNKGNHKNLLTCIRKK